MSSACRAAERSMQSTVEYCSTTRSGTAASPVLSHAVSGTARCAHAVPHWGNRLNVGSYGAAPSVRATAQHSTACRRAWHWAIPQDKLFGREELRCDEKGRSNWRSEVKQSPPVAQASQHAHSMRSGHRQTAAVLVGGRVDRYDCAIVAASARAKGRADPTVHSVLTASRLACSERRGGHGVAAAKAVRYPL